MKIEDEIKQGKFKSEQERLLINIIFSGNQFTLSNNRELKQFDLTSQQFNVLRILRGQNGNPISVKDIHSRMLDSTSNVSRLVDKLLIKDLIVRITSKSDRRRVELTITKKGLSILSKIDEMFIEKKHQLKSIITEEEAKVANEILDKFRIINQI